MTFFSIILMTKTTTPYHELLMGLWFLLISIGISTNQESRYPRNFCQNIFHISFRKIIQHYYGTYCSISLKTWSQTEHLVSFSSSSISSLSSSRVPECCEAVTEKKSFEFQYYSFLATWFMMISKNKHPQLTVILVSVAESERKHQSLTFLWLSSLFLLSHEVACISKAHEGTPHSIKDH